MAKRNMKRTVTVRKTGVVLPEPVKLDSRICFGIAFFATEADADDYARYVKGTGATYNGGFFNGLPCGRDKSFDYVDMKLGPLFAVTN